MSDYYDIDKPYSIENWNKLVQDVNEILENPPDSDDPKCQPIDPLKEPSNPHVWTTKDVTDMQDKLKKTCPDIEFEVGTPAWVLEHQWMWSPEIIDELVERMQQAWCQCDEGLDCGQFYKYGRLYGSSEEKCCNNIIKRYWPSGGHPYVWDYTEIEYFGEWFPRDETNPINSGFTAHNKMYNFEAAWNKMVTRSHLILSSQNKIDSLVDDIDSDIAYYNAVCKVSSPPGECAEYQERIQANGELAQAEQKILDASMNIWVEEKAKIENEEEVNEAAAENWSEWLSISPRFPESVNLVTDCFDPKITERDDLVNWFQGFNPYTSFLNAVRPSIKVGERWVKYPDDYEPQENDPPEYDGGPNFFCDVYTERSEPCEMEIGEIHFAPDGTPYSTTLNHFILSNSSGRTFSRFRYRCKCTQGCCENVGHYHTCIGALNPAENCYIVVEKGEWSEWDGEIPDITEGLDITRGIRQYKMEIDWGSSKGQDHTKEREAYLEEFTTWYDEHPKYDDRHASY